MKDKEQYIKKVEKYLYSNYQKKINDSQQWVLRKENGTINSVAQMVVECLKKDLKWQLLRKAV